VRLAAAALLLAISCLAANDLRLVDAVKRRDRKTAESLVREHVGLNATQPDGATALAWAVFLDDVKLAELLIAAGADVNTADEYGETPLTLACANGNAALADKLLKAGANPNAARWTGATPLMIAAGAGSSEAVKLLAARGAKIDAIEQRKGQNALMWAAAEGHADVVQALIGLGADVKAASQSGFTPMIFAAAKNDGKSIRHLVAAGADPAPKALSVAFAYRNAAAMSALVESGASPNITDATGATPLHAAAQIGDADLIRILLKKGADPNAKTAKAMAGRGGGGGFRRILGEQTALHMAAAAAHLDAMRALVAGGADPLLQSQLNTTLLMSAAGSGKPAIVKYVYNELDQRINAVGETGITVIQSALTGTLGVVTQQEICEMVRFLHEKGAKIDERALQIVRRAPFDKEQVLQVLTTLMSGG